jgi:hypothetical protein
LIKGSTDHKSHKNGAVGDEHQLHGRDAWGIGEIAKSVCDRETEGRDIWGITRLNPPRVYFDHVAEAQLAATTHDKGESKPPY